MRTYDLTPGVIDPSAESAFKHGACAALAIALHDATGWPLLAVTESDNVHDGKAGWGSALHWGVRMPDGRFLDIMGAHDDADVLEEYDAEIEDEDLTAAIGTSLRGIAVEWYVEAQGEPIPIRMAATFVDAVIARAAPSAPCP